MKTVSLIIFCIMCNLALHAQNTPIYSIGRKPITYPQLKPIGYIPFNNIDDIFKPKKPEYTTFRGCHGGIVYITGVSVRGSREIYTCYSMLENTSIEYDFADRINYSSNVKLFYNSCIFLKPKNNESILPTVYRF